MVRRLWSAAQATSVLVALLMVGLLLVVPELGLTLVWDLLIPVVPLLLFLSPQLWRNLCPISVVHQLPVRLGLQTERRLSPGAQRWAPAIAVGLLFLIVPLRHLVFNENALALAVFTVSVLVVSLVGTFALRGKAGWCATFCPVLPVERLYGQSPLIPVSHAHCAPCTGCIRDCYDLHPVRSLPSLIGGSGSLVRSPMGAFAALFPGFILGYFTVSPEAAPGTLYLTILGLALASALLTLLLQRLAGLTNTTMARLSAVAAGLIYYWYSVPVIVEGVATLTDSTGAPLTGVGVHLIRAGVLLLVGVWWIAASRRSRRERTG